MQLHTINTGFFKLDGGAMFGVVPKSLWNKVNPADENNLCTWALRCPISISIIVAAASSVKATG